MTSVPRHHRLLLLLLVAWYLLATLPRLADYPVVETAQMGIAAPAYKLATQGVYGNDLYRGFYRAELRNFDHMPLYPLALAAFFRALGVGIWQGRLLSVFCGLLTLALTYRLGRRVGGGGAGLLAAAALAALPLAAPGAAAGHLYPGRVPLLDIARVMRYDIMVPIWVVAAALAFLEGGEKWPRAGHFLVGVCTGLATLSHLYGAFILAPLLWLIWRRPCSRRLRLRQAAWLGGGLLTALTPWIAYVLGDLPAYRGQLLLRHQSKFDVLSLAFYADNLVREPWRYVKLVGGFRQPVLWPRAGLPLALAALLQVNISWWKRRRSLSRDERLVALSLPLLALLLALLISFKRYTYVVLILPFLAVEIAVGVQLFWRRARRRQARALLALALLAALAEGAVGLGENLRAAAHVTPYRQVTDAIRARLPADARLLMLHAYWLGLADYEAIALDLVYFLTGPAGEAQPPPGVADVIRDIDPDFILTRRELRTAYLHPPLDAATAALADRLAGVDAYLVAHCTPAYVAPPDPDYGTIELFACAAPEATP